MDVIDALCGLIKYRVKKLEHLQNVGRGNFDKFAGKVTAKVVPDSICDLLVQKYVVDVPVMEAIEKHAFLKEVKGLINDFISQMEDQEIFLALFGLKKYGIIDKENLQNISDTKKEFSET